MLLMQATERLVESARFRYFHHSLTYKPHMYSAKRIWSMRFLLRQKMYNTQSNAKHLLFHFETENTTPEFDIANKPGTMMPCMTSLPNKGAQTRKCLQIGINQKKVNAVNDSGSKTSSISWWPGRHPVSLHFSDVPTGSNNIYREATLGYSCNTFATNSFLRRTVVQIRLCTQRMIPHKKNRFDSMMA